MRDVMDVHVHVCVHVLHQENARDAAAIAVSLGPPVTNTAATAAATTTAIDTHIAIETDTDAATKTVAVASDTDIASTPATAIKTDTGNTVTSTDTLSDTSHACGHIPARLAHHITPLLDAGCITLSGHISMSAASLQGIPRATCHVTLTRTDARMDAMHHIHWQQLSRTPSHTSTSQQYVRVMDTMLERYAHLFTEHERMTYSTWMHMSCSAQHLCMRLFHRTDPMRWVCVDSITWDGDDSIQDAMQHAMTHDMPLIQSSHASCIPASPLYASLLPCLTGVVLRSICTQLHVRIKPSHSVAHVCACLLHHLMHQRTLSGAMLHASPHVHTIITSTCGTWMRLDDVYVTTCTRAYRLFYASHHVMPQRTPAGMETWGHARYWKQETCDDASIQHAHDATTHDAAHINASCPLTQHYSLTSLFPTRDVMLAYEHAMSVWQRMQIAVDHQGM